MENMKIRPIGQHELPLLEEFIYQAIFQRPTEKPLPRDIIQDPSIAVYINNFGQQPDDHCLVAEYDGKVVGAVWTRILNGNPKGFGNMDACTPEFAISVLPEFRKKGFGTMLMEEMICLLKRETYTKASLAVQKDNYALQLYKKVGFQIIEEKEEEYLMVISLL